MLKGSGDLVELLEHRAAESGPSVAFTYLSDGETTEENLTYAELARRARTVAVLLQAHARPGARIVLLYPPGLDYIAAFFGCLLGGYVAVPAYPPDPSRLNRTLPRLQAIVDDAGAGVVLSTSAILAMTEMLSAVAPDLGKKTWLATDGGADLAGEWRRPSVGPETLAFLQYTSGSTGTPKGVMLTHQNLLANERMIREVFKLSPESIGVGWLPLYHDMGLIGNVLQTVYVGFRCVLLSPLDFLQRPVRWLKAISRYGGTASGGPNFAYDLCARKVTAEERERLDLRTWKLAFSGAEPVRAETLERFGRAFAECGFRSEAFLPCYGLAEASLLVSGKTMGAPYRVVNLEAHALEEGRAAPVASSDGARSLVSTGHHVSGTRVVVVDPVSLRECAEGKVGEIWVSGPHVAIGYWGDAEKTAQTFQARLETEPDGETFLRTGDLGFKLDGEVFISGRLKDLIIIRGRNYYPQDIERVVEESYPTLRRGCAAAFSLQVSGEERLVVAVEVERRVRTADRRSAPPPPQVAPERRSGERRASDPPPGLGPDGREQFAPQDVIDAIRRSVAEHFDLNVHAIALLKPGTILKTSSGKIRRQACSAAFREGSLEVLAANVNEDSSAGAVRLSQAELEAAPPSERLPMVETYLRAALSGALRVSPERVDLSSPLNALGLDSLMAVEVAHTVERDLGVVLEVTSLLKDSTGRTLAEKLLAQVTAQAPPSRQSSRIDPGDESAFGLSAGQAAMWFLNQLTPDSAAYNIGTALEINGDLAPGALESALRALIARHPALHTTYASDAGGLVQRPSRGLVDAFRLELTDASSWSEEELSLKLAESTKRPFDLQRGPVFRGALFARSPTSHVLVLAAHHIAADLWTIVLLLSELRVLYASERAGRGAPNLLPTGARYRDFVGWQRAYLASADAARDWGGYWEKQLDGVPPLELPTDRVRPPVQTHAGAVRPLDLNARLVERMAAFAKREGVTVYTVLLAAFQLLLARWSGQRSFLVGSPVAGRPRAAYDRTVGYFVNVLPMRADLTGNPSIREHVRRVRDVVFGALEHQNLPFAEMVERLQPDRDPSRTPLFQAAFVLEKAYLEQESGVTSLVLHANARAEEFAGLELRAFPIAERAAQFDLTLSLAQGGGALSGGLEYNTDLFDAQTVERMATHFETLLSNAIELPETSVWSLRMMAEEEEKKVLFDWNATSADYDRGRCIHELFEQRVDESPSTEAVVFEGTRLTYAELESQANKLAHRLKRLGTGPESVVALCADRSLAMVVGIMGILKAGGIILPLDPEYPRERLEFMVDDAHVTATVVSGAHWRAVPTKGAVLVLDDPAGDLAAESGDRPRGGATSRNGAHLSYTSGSTGRPKGVFVDHDGICNLTRAQQRALGLQRGTRVVQFFSLSFDSSTVWEILTCLGSGATLVVASSDDLVPGDPLAGVLRRHRVTMATFPVAVLAAMDRVELPDLGVLATGGEAVSREVVNRWAPGRRFFNVYGPTEATVVTLMGECFASERGRPSIGRPMPNTQVYILDQDLRPTPIGVVGELYLAGVPLGRGVYHARPELTADKFVPNPFHGGRMYRTGDLAKWLPDGRVDCLGRVDGMVKIRGHRIELDEVDAVVREHELVLDSTILVRDVSGEKSIVAYVLSNERAETVATAVREHARSKLPAYMVPSAVVVMTSFPLTPNGKVDRKALPAPPRAPTRADFQPPQARREQYVAAVFADVLGVEHVGMTDSFFELGGHSLTATRLVSRLADDLGVRIDLRRVFERPTPAGLLAALEEAVGGADVLEEITATLASVDQMSEEEAAEALKGLTNA